MNAQKPDNQAKRFVQMAKQFHPALLGEIGPAKSLQISINRNNHKILLALYEHWQQKYPEAGKAYWSARCWTLLIWQPIFLCIVAVHGGQQLLPLNKIHQHYSQGVVAGFNLSTDELPSTGEPLLINQMAQELGSYCETLITQCQLAFGLRPLLAIRLAADTLLSALLGLPALIPSIELATTKDLADRWLLTLGWQQQSALMPIQLTNGSSRLALNRKSCCFDYCRDDGAVCSSCPRQSLAIRKMRIAEELSAHYA